MFLKFGGTEMRGLHFPLPSVLNKSQDGMPLYAFQAENQGKMEQKVKISQKLCIFERV